MQGFPREFVEAVREATDLVNLVGDYLSLRKAGKNFSGLCPFHSEKTPSFSVSPDRQLFYCFGCQAGGDVFDFIARKEGVEFPEAVTLLARRAGMQLPRQDEAASREHRAREEVLRALELAARFYASVLHRGREAAAAREYLAERGLNAETVAGFRLGFAPDSWDGLQKALVPRGIQVEVLVRAGLVQPRDRGQGFYDRFRGRIMFPISDQRGRVVGFGGRVLHSDPNAPKYLNSPETLVFNKSRLLFALAQARQAMREAGWAVMVEGYLDAISAHQSGIRNVVASLGTSLSEEQARLLRGYADEAVIAYDADAAGTRATFRGLEILRQHGLRVKVLSLPAGQDPDSFIREHGREEFLNLARAAKPLLVWRFDQAAAEHGTGDTASKIKVAEEMVPLLARVDNAVERDAQLREFARRLDISEESLRQEVKRFLDGIPTGEGSLENQGGRHRKLPGWYNNKQTVPKDTSSPPSALLPGFLKAEREVLAILLRYPSFVDGIRDRISPGDFLDPRHREVAETLLATAAAGEDSGGEGPVDGGILGDIPRGEVRSLVSGLLLEEDRFPDPGKTLDGCIKTMLRHKMKERREEIRAEIRENESTGKVTPVSLLRELDELNQRIHGL